MRGFRYVMVLVSLVLLDQLGGCTKPDEVPVPPLATGFGNVAAPLRTNGSVGSVTSPPPIYAYSPQGTRPGHAPDRDVPPGPFSVEFAETDIRDAVAQILGTLLHASYTIDPAVHGTVTLHSGHPLAGRDLVPVLQNLLASVGAVLIPDGGLYRIVPATAAGAAGSLVIPLRFVSADELAKVLQPLAGTTAKIAAASGVNALLISGDPAQVQAVRDLVQTFDSDELAHQSYALLPVTSGGAHDFADAMQEAFRGKSGGSLAGLVRVVPLVRLNAVLVISAQPRYIDEARKVFGLVERQRRNTVRSWQVYYLQNSNANDIAYTLQMAFTPNNVTAQPQDQQSNGAKRAGSSGGFGDSRSGGGLSAAGGIGGVAGGGVGGGGVAGGGTAGLNPVSSGAADSGSNNRSVTAVAPASNPLLGGLDTGSASDTTDSMRILPNGQNNAILIYGTPQEEDQVVGMLRKIDIIPLQVQIDATIAEVTLNDSLQYGTQFFFKSGGINGILNSGSAALGTPASTVLNTSFPGFILSGNGQGGAPIALSALQAVTQVHVLSSPQITVVDNQQARLQVGALVPYLLATSTSTLTSSPQIVNSIGYQPTGVILEVTPRVNSGGMVTLDISQEVSEVASSLTTNGIQSPTFQERNVSSRVVVEDGQTVGIAGLIQDSISKGNQGIPWLKDIPLLGVLAGAQNNTRQRTELLVLITPHVIRDQSQMRKLTEDMRDALSSAAAVPYVSASEPASGSSDPNARVRASARRLIGGSVAPR